MRTMLFSEAAIAESKKFIERKLKEVESETNKKLKAQQAIESYRIQQRPTIERESK